MKLVRDAIAAGIFNDLVSSVGVCNIEKLLKLSLHVSDGVWQA